MGRKEGGWGSVRKEGGHGSMLQVGHIVHVVQVVRSRCILLFIYTIPTNAMDLDKLL